MEQLGGIIFLVIFLLVLPGIAIWGIISFLKSVFKETRKSLGHMEDKTKEDGNYFESSDGVNEYHQYSYYLSGTKDSYEHIQKDDTEIVRETRITYRMFPFTENIFGKYRYSEVSIPILNPRYKIRNKIVITENYGGIQKIGIHITAFTIKICSILLVVGLLGLPILVLVDRITGIIDIDAILSANILYYSGLLCFTLVFVFLFGRFNNIATIQQKLSRQGMESLEFENSFDAFSMDPIEARMIMTPAFMERLEQFSNQWGLKGKIRMIWKENTITLILKGDIEKYGINVDGNYTLIESLKETLKISYYSLDNTNL